MTAEDVLIELVARGAILWVDDGRLRFGAPEGAVDADLRAAAGGVRAELLGLLQDGAVLPADRAAWNVDGVHDFEERAAIIEFDGGTHRAEAEDRAVRLVREAWTRAKTLNAVANLRRCGLLDKLNRPTPAGKKRAAMVRALLAEGGAP